jgi:hypothetical protein
VVSILTFTATDNTAVTGYLITESATTPSVNDVGWSLTAPTEYTFSSEGSKTLYAWAKDAVGNVSTGSSDTVTITLPTPASNPDPTPVVTYSSGGGSSASSRIFNLISLGFLDQARQIADQYGLTVPTQTLTTQNTNTPTQSNQTFSRFLSFGMTGSDIKQLQIFLNNNGFTVANSGPGSKGKETNYYGPATKAAIVKFQEAHAKEILTPQGLKKGNGVFGPATRRVVRGE